MDKKQAQAYVENFREELRQVSDEVWDAAELAFREHRSASALGECLRRHGFSVEEGAGGIDTAFTARAGSGRPVIGLLGEYDALAGMGEVPEAFRLRESGGGAAAHGCGHNLLGVGSLGAALILRHYLEETGKEGTVVYFGCPGEEGGSGKAFMAREGVFDELDCALTWHPGSANSIFAGCLANVQVLYRFRGVSAHASAAPEQGRSALDAVELMNVGVQYLREHMGSRCRVHYAILDTGGPSPNVVQSHASVLYLIRAENNGDVRELRRRVDLIADGAALMTETEVEKEFVKACTDYRGNEVLERVLHANLEALPMPVPGEGELEYIRKLNAACPPADLTPGKDVLEQIPEGEREEFARRCREEDLIGFTTPYVPGRQITGSTDVGDVSAVCPTAQCFVATFTSRTPGHTWQTVAQGTADYARERMLCASKVLAGAAIDLLEDPALLKAAKDEYARTHPDGYACPIPEGVKPRVVG